ncbi:hypothetical protein AUJ14_02115 [Candidatus Micrarchaeota archaeon CG1_02_55_22]|nr:MAG: hypothetical protein AUJ14_02115 [Candidatus Micrarchaeota archaeon CG1_02_55_22]
MTFKRLVGLFELRVARDFESLPQHADAGAYLSGVALATACASFAVLALFYAFGAGASAVVYAVLTGALVFIVGLYYPTLLRQRHSALLERDFPLAVKTIAAQTAAGVPFEQAFASACTGFGAASGELSRVLSQWRAGTPFPKAVSSFAARAPSLAVKRTCMQLSLAYRQGAGSQELEQLSSELASQALASARAYNSDTTFSSLFFVAVSCVVPCLFAAYVILSSVLFEPVASPRDLALIFLVVFPLLNAALLVRMALRAPPSMVG